jgi:hypothetical protein
MSRAPAARIELPRQWPRRVKAALLGAVALATSILVRVRGDCLNSPSRASTKQVRYLSIAFTSASARPGEGDEQEDEGPGK